MGLTDDKTVTLDDVLEKGEGPNCSTPNVVLLGRDPKKLILEKLSNTFTSGVDRILFINPPATAKDNFDLGMAKALSYSCYPPYNLGLLSQRLIDKGYQTDIIDLNFEVLEKAHALGPEEFNYDDAWQKKLEERIKQFNPELIGITCMYTMIHPSMQAVADYISNFNKKNNSRVPIIVGGAHPTLAAEEVLTKCTSIDFVSMYESDNSFPDLIEIINKKKDPSQLAQVATLVDNKYFALTERNTPSEEVITKFPNYHDLQIGRYTDLGKIGVYATWLRGEETKCTTILKSRGCRAKCSFCSVREFNGKGVRHRDSDDVVNEIKWLKDNYGIEHLVWLDDDLLNDKRKTLELFNKMGDSKLGVTWDASNGVIAAALDEEIAKAAEYSGCIGMSFGIESGNPEILKRIHKPATLDRFVRASEILDRHPNIFTKGFLIIGFPADGENPPETIGQIWDTIALAKKMHLDWYTVQICMPLPGTELEANMVKGGQKKGDIANEAVNRFMTGFGNGLQRKYELEMKKKSTSTFENILHRGSDYIPNREELKDIWLLTDYYINFEDIPSITNPKKLEMKEKWLGEICKRKSSENPLGNLYLGIIQDKIGMYDKANASRDLAKQYLSTSDFWKVRFEHLDLYTLLENSEKGQFRLDNLSK